MIMMAICSALIGAIFATRFKVFVLLFAIFLAAFLFIGMSLLQDRSLASAVIATLVFAVAAQLGYVCSAYFNHVQKSTHVDSIWSIPANSKI